MVSREESVAGMMKGLKTAKVRFALRVAVPLALMLFAQSCAPRLNGPGTEPKETSIREDAAAALKAWHEVKAKKRAIEMRLRADYDLDRGDIVTMRFSPLGNIEYISIYGDFTPPRFRGRAHTDEKAEYARTVAMAFLKKERKLLGLKDPSTELGEVSFEYVKEKGIVYLKYSRYIRDVRVEGVKFQFVFKGTRAVSFLAWLRPVTPELIAAIKDFEDKGLSEEGAMEAIAEDLRLRGVAEESISQASFESLMSCAVARPPYVVYRGYVHYEVSPERKGVDLGKWGYEIDAISGEVLDKATSYIDTGTDRIVFGVACEKNQAIRK